MLENPLIFWFYRIFGIELPYFDNMEAYLFFIRGKIGHLNKGISSEEIFMNKTWIEIRDTDDAHEVISHIFKPKMEPLEIAAPRGEDTGFPYLYSVDGKVTKGRWTRLYDGSLIIKMPGAKSIVYSPFFANEDFLILMTKGDIRVHENRRLIFFARENVVIQKYEWYDNLGRKGEAVSLEWRDIMELFFNLYRFNLLFVIVSISLAVLLLTIVYLSI